MTHKPIAQEVEEALDELDRMLAERRAANRPFATAVADPTALNVQSQIDAAFDAQHREAPDIAYMRRSLGQLGALVTEEKKRYGELAFESVKAAAAQRQEIKKALDASSARTCDRLFGNTERTEIEKIMDKVSIAERDTDVIHTSDTSYGATEDPEIRRERIGRISEKMAGEGLVRAPKTFTRSPYKTFHHLSESGQYADAALRWPGYGMVITRVRT